MTKRTLAGLLWFGVGWTVGSMLSLGYSLPGLVAPVLAVALAGLVAWDPMGKIWPVDDRVPKPRFLTRRVAPPAS